MHNQHFCYPFVTHVPKCTLKQTILKHYSGTGQQWVAPVAATYTMECWGANGGAATFTVHPGASGNGGTGGYTKGEINLANNSSLYVYVGSVGGVVNSGNSGGGWNGGGNGVNDWDSNNRASAGGGATDIRITNGNWNNTTSLRTRIMVAGGGGGACQSQGGDGGGLIGLYLDYGYANYGSGSASDGQGGKQNGATSNGGFSYGTTTSSFGTGSAGLSIGGGGGGGWWGGAGGSRAPKHDGAGGGGSSFISGHPGCNAVNTSTGAHLGASTTIEYNHVTYTFTSTVMIDGSGKQWTTASQTTGGTAVGIPAKPETTSDGYARITYIP